ncbi:GNAT family N-acetyltransferase [Actinokineospora soli]|uniref:GNAT family N-acetyltransferase n=1 Tax=Actinokineospora soli TaxID=1048753 RepID=A0ABW2TVR2_9PSEU
MPEPPTLAGEVRSAGGAAGVASFQEWPAGSLSRTWQPARRHRLDVRLAGPDQAGDLGKLVDRWLADLPAETAGDPDCAAVVDLPSRDVAAVPALIARGFVPVAVAAVRRASSPTPADGVRPATPADLDAAVRLNLEVVAYDAHFGKVTMRADSGALLADGLRERLARPGAWVAERDGGVVGLVTVQVPPESDWAAGLTSAPVAGYLETMSVTSALRGSGIGSALVSHAHAALDAVTPVTVLHHALANPLSTPFWYRHGYRPLWTTWQRRPATPAG